MSFNFSIIDIEQAASILDSHKTIAVTHIDGILATQLQGPAGQQGVLVQGTGDSFLYIH